MEIVTESAVAGDPYLDLMRFSDPVEQEIVLGPLYATAAQAGVAVFGRERFTTKKVKAALNEVVKKSLESTNDPVVDLLAPSDPAMGATESSISSTESPGDDFIQLHLEPKESKHQTATANASSELVISKNVYSSRELYEKSHYSALSRFPSTKSAREQLDHIMLRRAMDGYLLNPDTNKSITADDSWLQEVWEWISGMLHSLHLCSSNIIHRRRRGGTGRRHGVHPPGS